MPKIPKDGSGSQSLGRAFPGETLRSACLHRPGCPPAPWGSAGVWPSEPKPEATSIPTCSGLPFSFFSFYSMFLVAWFLPWPSLAASCGEVCPCLGPRPTRGHRRRLDAWSLLPGPRPSVHLAHPGPSTIHTVPFVKTLPLVSWGDEPHLNKEGQACTRWTGRPNVTHVSLCPLR